ncbi:peptidase [Ruminococcaceae bacterium OttesenSCG-928-N02]|nr:peptidase [Ruminococcaceae bacterium OttesenSCG-928-N02]
MKKQIPLNIVITVLLIAMTVTFSITMIIAMNIFERTVSSTAEKAAMYDKISEIDSVVRQNYYGEVPDTINDRIAAGYISGIQDSYARYYTAEQYTQYLNRQSGRLLGIGVDIVKDAASGYGRIVRVYANSPAAEVAIEAGWYIVTINGQDVKTLSIEAITNLLLGEVGTQVEIGLINGTEQKTVTVVHKSYEASGVEYSSHGTVGYIRITRVNSSTPAQFDYAVQQLLSNGAKSLVFDWRGIASTNFEEIARMLDALCPAGTLISAQYKDGTSKVLYTSNQSQVEVPMVCIVNAGTSGAPEVFCQVLKDYGKTRIVGVATAGRGSLQTFFRLSDGSAVEITTARILTPVRGLLDASGVMPDYEATLTAAQEAAFYEMKIEDDPQIYRAFEVANGLVQNVEIGGSSSSSRPSSSVPDSSIMDDSSRDDDASSQDDSSAA